MIKSLLTFIQCLWRSINKAIEHDGIEHAGYISFLLMLTIFPFLVFFVSIVGFFGEREISETLVNIILSSSWASFIDALKPRILEISSAPPQSLLTIAVLSAIWTASSIFEALRTIINKAYRVVTTPNYILRRLLSIGEFLVAITIALCFVLIMIVIPAVFQNLSNLFSVTPLSTFGYFAPEFNTIRFTLIYIFTFLLISISYHFLPNRKQNFMKVVPGALLVLCGWVVFSKLFTYYIGNFPQVNLIYGSLAGIIISLLYFYFCSIIYIVGAEFNYQLEQMYFKKRKRA